MQGASRELAFFALPTYSNTQCSEHRSQQIIGCVRMVSRVSTQSSLVTSDVYVVYRFGVTYDAEELSDCWFYIVV